MTEAAKKEGIGMEQASWLLLSITANQEQKQVPVGPSCPWPQDSEAVVEQWPRRGLQLPQRELWCEASVGSSQEHVSERENHSRALSEQEG